MRVTTICSRMQTTNFSLQLDHITEVHQITIKGILFEKIFTILFAYMLSYFITLQF